MLRSRKVDKAGHSADTTANALSGVILGIRFWRCRERQTDSMQTMQSAMLDGKGKEALKSCIVSADHRYLKQDLFEIMNTFGVAPTFVMPDHLFRVHPFVAASAPVPHRQDDEAESANSTKDANKAGSETTDTNSTSGAIIIADLNSHPNGIELDTSEDGQVVSDMHTPVADRRRVITVDGSILSGPAGFKARKALRFSPGNVGCML